MIVQMEHPVAGLVKSLAFPGFLSDTPVSYRIPPPRLGEHTQQVLAELGYNEADVAMLAQQASYSHLLWPVSDRASLCGRVTKLARSAPPACFAKTGQSQHKTGTETLRQPYGSKNQRRPTEQRLPIWIVWQTGAPMELDCGSVHTTGSAMPQVRSFELLQAEVGDLEAQLMHVEDRHHRRAGTGAAGHAADHAPS